MSKVKAARAAEKKLAEIARTRRPTEAETAEALAAYAAAAAESPIVCPFCGQERTLDTDECGGDGEGICQDYADAIDAERESDRSRAISASAGRIS